MLKYIFKRLGYMIFVIFVISILMFGIYKMVPGDPVMLMMEGKSSRLSPAQYEEKYNATRKKLGLDKPVVVQYVYWAKNMVTGDFGYSIIHKVPVAQMAAPYMQNTIKLNIVGLILVFSIAIPIGILQAVKKGKFFDNFFQVSTIIGYSLPIFIFGIIFIFLFAVKIPLFPISGTQTIGFEGNAVAAFFDKAKYMVLPISVYVFASLGGITRYVRASMIDSLRMDYIRTARSKGLAEKVVIYSHAFRNSLIPIVTIVMSWFIGIFSGSVLIERIFLWNGMGNVMITSLMQQDFAVVLAFNMFYALLALFGNLLMDIGYALVDPRVKLS